jgi:diaminopimelate epimerase
MEIRFLKYEGAGNDFILVDNREEWFDADNVSFVKFLCNRRFGIGADGLILIQERYGYDFEMRYFNSDGREASMCGNGGRCITAFARKLGIIDTNADFLAVDGPHEAVVETNGLVNLKMADVPSYEMINGDFYLNTGSPHYVVFLDTLEGLDVDGEGRKIRYSDRFKEVGTNVNFARLMDGKLTVYTYERGVENETLACGTGITATALCAAVKSNLTKGEFPVKAKGGHLSVSFERTAEGFKNIWLKGPATFVFEGTIEVG